MAAFQLFNYSKPGPGVQKNAPPKKRTVLFFELFFRKFTNFSKLNLLFLIPVVMVAVLVSFLIIVAHVTIPILAFLPVILLFPFIAGLTFVTRNYAREEHAFIYSDFKDTVKANWKQFLVHGVITYFFFMLMYIAITFYSSYLPGNSFFYVPMGICCAVSLIFLFMQYYIPIMIITFDLKLKAIYKNALILSIAGMGYNFLLTIVLALLFVVGFVLAFINGLTILIDILIALFFFFSFTSFLINFTIYPVIEKYMIKPLYETKEEPEKPMDAFAEENLDDEAEDADSAEDGADIPKNTVAKTEYEYVNGRLVKKTDAESIFEDKT